MGSNPAFILSLMAQQVQVNYSHEDWSGISSSAERRKLQNRLNQRAHRRRKRGEKRLETANDNEGSSDPSHLGQICQEEKAPSTALEKAGQGRGSLKPLPESEIELVDAGPIMLSSSPTREMLLQFARDAYASWSMSLPRPQQLKLLIKLNALNAFARNAQLLGFQLEGMCADWIISPFNQKGPMSPKWKIDSYEYLRPTSLQCSITHHPWSDLIPIPQMRDRVLQACEDNIIDEDELAEDLLLIHWDQEDQASLIAWDDPWTPGGWEASPAFLRKWGWLIKDCKEIIESTNHWRVKRGEPKIKFS